MSGHSLDEMDFDEIEEAQRENLLAEIDGLSPRELAKYANKDFLQRGYNESRDEFPGYLAD